MTTTNGTPPETAIAPRPAQPPGIEPPAQYATGFEGMATGPFPDTAIIALTAPIEAGHVEVKPDGIVYLPGVWYRQRLTAAFGPGGWSLAPRGPSRVRGDLVTYHGALYALGRFVSEAVGECQYHESNKAMSYASALEGARTDCLTRCCKDLLVAMELWDPGFRERWLAEWALCAWYKTKQGDNKKMFWRRDRERPWQVQDSTAEPARVLPEGAQPQAPKGPARAPVPPAPSGASAAASSTAAISASSSDDSPRVDGDDLIDLRETLIAMGWKKRATAEWFQREFGCKPEALTKAQAKRAHELLAELRARPPEAA